MNAIYDIYWKKTIEHFSKLNTLYFIFMKNPKNKEKKQKKYIFQKKNEKK